MIKRSFFLLTFICLASPVQAMVGDISHNMFTSNNTYTHTPIELKPASFLELDIPSLKGAYKTASVCFLGDKDCAPDANVNEDKNSLYSKCIAKGYKKTASDCIVPWYPALPCPDSSEYFRLCLKKTGKACEDLGYVNTCPDGQVENPRDTCEYDSSYFKCNCNPKLVSCSPLQVGSGASCGGKYETCSCDSTFFKYNFVNCQSPKILGGNSCEGASSTGLVESMRYSECKCPMELRPIINYGCKEYYPAPCDSVCKTYYTDNCHNREEATGSYGCESYWSDCPSKCQKAYADNCRNRTEVTAQYGCETYWADCSKKCQTAFPDNCHTRVDRAVPVNASCSMSYSDCASKCANWRCNSGFTYWCSKPETNCATLGYTQSASQCSGDYLVCPYGTNVYCVEQ